MAAYRVVLVSPMHDGNVGAVARSMGNFDFNELCLVSPCPLTEEAFKRAKHAGKILENAIVVDSFDEAVRDSSLIVGTTGIVTSGQKHFVRIPETPRDFAMKAAESDGKITLVFGPEDLGLTQEQLKRCDVLVNIPSYEGYPVLNLSHAVTILLYEIFQTNIHVYHPSPATAEEKELLYSFFHNLLEAIEYPDFRREKTEIMFRRLMGRSVPTKWEFYTIMGVIGDAVKKINKGKKDGA